MIKVVSCTLALFAILILSTCQPADPGPFLISGTINRSTAGTPDNCLVGIFDAASVNISTSLPAPIYAQTVTFSSSSTTYAIDNIPSGSYYFGAFLGVDSGTIISTAELGFGGSTSYANPFMLVATVVDRDTVKDIQAADWILFP
jgi:hypothetical protein